MPHDATASHPSNTLCTLLQEANNQNVPVIIGADANSHHQIWGSTNTNSRGESLFDFIISNNLAISNRGEEPTFITTNRREVLDITLVSESISNTIRDWKVLEECSHSDHRYITFNIDRSTVTNTEPFINRKRTNWEEFRSALAERLDFNPPTITNIDDLEDAVMKFNSAYEAAAKIACTPVLVRGKVKPPWWDPEIARLRLLCRKIFREAKRTQN